MLHLLHCGFRIVSERRLLRISGGRSAPIHSHSLVIVMVIGQSECMFLRDSVFSFVFIILNRWEGERARERAKQLPVSDLESSLYV